MTARQLFPILLVLLAGASTACAHASDDAAPDSSGAAVTAGETGDALPAPADGPPGPAIPAGEYRWSYADPSAAPETITITEEADGLHFRRCTTAGCEAPLEGTITTAEVSRDGAPVAIAVFHDDPDSPAFDAADPLQEFVYSVGEGGITLQRDGAGYVETWTKS